MGSFTDKKPGTGLHIYDLDQKSGHLTLLDSFAPVVNSSYLSLSKNGKTLYACTDTQLEKEGSVSAFRIKPKTGKLTFLNEYPAGGRNPVHLALSPDGSMLIDAMYTDAGISAFRFNKDGSLKPYVQHFDFTGSSIEKGRQEEAHVHSTNFSPDGQFVIVQDLGSDKLHVLEVKPKDSLPLVRRKDLDIDVKPGSGPRHFTFHPNGKYAYLLSEMGGTITVYSYNNGKLTEMDSYRSSEQKNITFRAADIHISPDGRFLYTSNRDDENSIGVFGISTATGKLSLAGHETTFGKHPRSFVIDPSGKFLIVANQFSNNLTVFRRNQKTGLLTKLRQQIKVNAPASLKMKEYPIK